MCQLCAANEKQMNYFDLICTGTGEVAIFEARVNVFFVVHIIKVIKFM